MGFRWVCVVSAVLSCSDWVYLGFLLILGWVDFWVSVDFRIFFCARLRCLVVVLGLVVGFVVVWWWRWLLPRTSLLQFDRGERKKELKNRLHGELMWKDFGVKCVNWSIFCILDEYP